MKKNSNSSLKFFPENFSGHTAGQKSISVATRMRVMTRVSEKPERERKDEEPLSKMQRENLDKTKKKYRSALQQLSQL
jgi:hypothetical protein